MEKKLSRYEINQKIKRTLVSNGADVTALAFSFSGKTAWLSGRFNKTGGAAMSQGEIEIICRALMDLPVIQYLNFDVEDWNITCSIGSFIMTRKFAGAAAPDRERKPLIIRTKTDGTVEDTEEDGS